MTPLQKIKEFEAAFPIYLTAIVVGVVYLFLMEILHLQQFRGVVAALGLLVLWVVFGSVSALTWSSFPDPVRLEKSMAADRVLAVASI